MKKGLTTLKVEALLFAGLIGVALCARLIPGERTIDDAYITFRYARNLLEGHGFVYNHSEHILGTTTPLYTLLLAGLAMIAASRDFPALALALNAVAGALAVGLLYALGKKLSGRRAPALAAALLWAVAPYSVTFAIGGMETDLTIALLIAASYAHVLRHSRIMAVLSALALLARPDTAILIGLLWLDLTISSRRIPWEEGAIALALLAPWLVFGTFYFGSPLTTSIAAKSVTYRIPPEADFVRLLQHYATPFFENHVLPPHGVLVVFALYCGLCTLAGLKAWRRERRTLPLTAYPFVYFAVFAAANPFLFRWYLSPPIPFYVLLIATGVDALAHDLKRTLTKEVSTQGPKCHAANLAGHQLPKTATTLFAIAALSLSINAWELHPNHGPDRPAPEMAWFELELLYAQAADIVLSHAQPGDSLCAGDIGVLGYRTNLRILDTVGLVTPASRQHYPTSQDIYADGFPYAIPADLVLALNPDHVVILEVYGRRDLIPDPRFQARYRLTDKLKTPIYGSYGMLVFQGQPVFHQ